MANLKEQQLVLAQLFELYFRNTLKRETTVFQPPREFYEQLKLFESSKHIELKLLINIIHLLTYEPWDNSSRQCFTKVETIIKQMRGNYESEWSKEAERLNDAWREACDPGGYGHGEDKYW